MKRFLILPFAVSVVLVAWSCTSSHPTNSDQQVVVPTSDSVVLSDIEPESPEWYGNTPDSLRELYDAVKVRKPYVDRGLYQVGENVIFPLRNKKLRLISNVTDDAEEQFVEYRALGRIPSNKCYVYKASYYEGTSFFLVDHATGEVDTLSSAPIFAKGEKRFVELSSKDDVIYGSYETLGFRVWDLGVDGKWSVIKEVIQQEWVPMSVKWDGLSRVLLSVLPVEEFQSASDLSPQDILVFDI